jgi:phospholipase A1/A2
MRTLSFGAGHVGALLLALFSRVSDAHLASCAAIDADRDRLACYDALARAERSAAKEPAPSPPATQQPREGVRVESATALEQRWELRPDLQQGTFKLLPYRPLYALLHGTSNTNTDPRSPTRALGAQDIELDRLEGKLQLSFKTKLAQHVLGSSTDLWFGYTQQSYWQFANSRYSSPFRETNYEPEAILIHPLSLQAQGIDARYVGFSFTHQSNGRGESLSRSWNRFIGEFAIESGPWSHHFRPWVRVFDASGARDDNPDIEDYVGRGELVSVYRAGGHVVTLTGRHTLRGGDRSRGSAQLDWAFPLAGSMNGHMQIFSGYGENLIDYNHRQTTVGVGVSFFD